MDITVLCIAIALACILYTQGGKAYGFYLFRQRVNKIPGPNFAIPFFGIVCKILTMPKEVSADDEDSLGWSENIMSRFNTLSPYNPLKQLYFPSLKVDNPPPIDIKVKNRIAWYRDTANKYKDGCFRSWVGTTAMVHIKKPEHIETILRSTREITKSVNYDYLKPWLGQGLLTSTGRQWHRSRKLITPAFHFNVLEEFTEVMFDKTAIFITCIERANESHGDKPFDIFALSMRYTLDVICETAMGVDVHAQDEQEHDYTKAVHTITAGAVNRFYRPWLRPDWIFYRTSSGKDFQAAVNVADDLCNRVIRTKQRSKNRAKFNGHEKDGAIERGGRRKKKAFLDLLLEANEKEDSPMTVEDLRNQINTFMFAGHDTTSTLIAWTFFCLGNELDVQKRVHDELDQVLGDSDNQATLERLPNLKYLERVIKEVLRLYPSVTTVARRLTNDMQIGDYIAPKDATVAIHIYQVHTDPSVWADPLRFEPDRFLPENISGRHPYAYVPFSAGPRNCIGQKFAKLEAKLALVQVLRKFTVKCVDSHSTMKKYNNVILRPVDGIYVYMTERSSSRE